MSRDLRDAVFEALGSVLDPCSVATRTPLSVVEMGMVRRVEVDVDGHVGVTLCPTTPSCILIASIMRDAEDTIGALPDVATVDVQLDSESFWTPDLMSEEGKSRLEAGRATFERHREAPAKWIDRRDDGRSRAGRPVAASRGQPPEANAS